MTDLRSDVERVLRENGLTDRPDQYDSSIHSWRCEHPDRYGPCTCFAELVGELTAVCTSPAGSTSSGALAENVRAVVRLLGGDHITPMGKRQILQVLDEHAEKDRPVNARPQ